MPPQGKSLGSVRVIVASCLLTVAAVAVEAQAPYLVKDLNTLPAPGAPPAELTLVGGHVFFRGCDRTHGCELWRTDGTAASTALVKDIQPGFHSSYPSFLTEHHGVLFFVAYDGTHGYELWKSDGTASGTVLVRDISPGGGPGLYPYGPTSIGGTLLFSANDGSNGYELWKSDGTTAGTAMVKDLRPGPEGSSPAVLTNVNGTAFFAADDGTHGYELWKSDGTPPGTVMVKDISPGPNGSRPGAYSGPFANVNGTFFFDADDGLNGRELWKSDGTAAGTVIVKDINRGLPPPGATVAGSYPYALTNVNGTLFFAADLGFMPGRHPDVELWKSDGTEAGTVQVADIRAGPDSSFPWELTNVDGTLFLIADDGAAGNELWKSDGTPAGTVIVRDLNPGAWSSYPAYLRKFGGALLFSADDGVNGYALWTSDGSLGGTAVVTDIDSSVRTQGSSPTELTDAKGTLFFTAGLKLWQSDGTEAGTRLVTPGSVYGDLASVQGTLFFAGYDGRGTELWRSDGTAPGTYMVKDIAEGIYSSGPSDFEDVNGTLFFTAVDTSGGFSPHGRELWKSDGTAGGTVMVKDINPGSESALQFPQLTNASGRLFFTAEDGVHGSELWKSDGTAPGTTMVKDIKPGPPSFGAGSHPRWFTDVNGTLFFAADDGASGRELWKSDGTEAGTVMVKDVNPGPGPSVSPYSNPPLTLTPLGGPLLFAADDGASGVELWRSDGTEAGTVMVKDINPGPASSRPADATNVNGTVFFGAGDVTDGSELWQSDGTDEGTRMVADINPDGSSFPRGFVVSGARLFFSADDGLVGPELWAFAVVPDVSITVDDGLAVVLPGQGLTYRITVTNPSVGLVGCVAVTDMFPAALQTVSWTCAAAGGASCSASGFGDIIDAVELPGGSGVTYTITGTVSPTATGTLSNTATVTVPPEVPDPDLSNNSSTDVDVLGGSAAALDFFTVSPCRLVDTRGNGAPLAGPELPGQQTRVFEITGRCGIPPGARAVSFNVAITQPTAAGNLRLFPAGQAVPTISSINYGAGQTRSSNAVVPLNASGELAAFVAQAVGTTIHVIIDVTGYFE